MGWKEVDENLAKRKSQSIANVMSKEANDSQNSILISANDLGVVINGGRRGAALGPRVLISQLQKFANHQKIKNISLIDITDQSEDDFKQMQKNSINEISKIKSQKIIHLGGGHDHIYPLVSGLKLNNPLIINIDAHLDTRDDEIHHSGTPFRQLANENKIKLLQIGIHEYANVSQNYQGIEMDVIDTKTLKQKSNLFRDVSFLNEVYEKHDGDIVFSIDADAISGSDMQSVSAVNHDGIPFEFLRMLVGQYQEYTKDRKQIMGIYEYNPLFDELSAKDARSLASLIYDYLI
ncbi:arginase family protein [Halobacteriovorax sp. BALOs_7]|uniref:arginase family protein n=1 Tax=Halobacteriovorax sp. BALOs_7 TaxID=2109558 RepID=UPI000EA1315A|nr:arginase family protein [Halobacteriovorax sp. BALOs_7]AYF44981.1 arginase family protein [Halobacteriovorax sp. BALOs_7]